MAKGKQQKDKAAAPLFHQDPAAVYDQDHDDAYENAQKAKAHHRKSNMLYNIAIVFFALLFLVSGGVLAKRFYDDRQTENEFASLQSMIEPVSAEQTADDAPVKDNTARFAALQARNPDFMGWISIEGTNLSFPVMYAPSNKDFYLRHDFDGAYSNYGVPYLDEKCILGQEGASNNLVVYGHNMKTGTIFGCLTEYKKADYYAAHPTITFDTLYGDGNYEVFGAFAIDVVEDQSFWYNTYLNMDETQFAEFVNQVKTRSDVDSGITPVYGDELLTLSTCEYSTSNGRYVVCARKVTP